MAFKKYKLSESQLTQIARLCVQEQGCIAGVKAEASLMANQLETSPHRQKQYGADGNGLYSWVRNGKWFYESKYYMDHGSASKAQIEAVREVLCEGKRTLPQYVDEHDAIGDIEYIKLHGEKVSKTNKANYRKGETIIKNKMGDSNIYTFYCFPAEGCDPFGYTQDAYNYVKEHGSYAGVSPDKVIEVASGEVGYLEKKSAKDLDSKTANAGDGNYTKYARDLFPSLQGQAWCDMFVDWCFMKAYGKETARKLLGDFSAYTPDSAERFKLMDRWHSNGPKKGDVIFFANTERICHTGIVYKVDDTIVYTIEGNTSAGEQVIPNGGSVCKKSYKLYNSRIAGYGRPDYSGTDSSGSDPEPVKKVWVKAELPMLRKGMHGDAVMVWQIIAGVDPDGDFGSRTLDATVDFQTAHGLDGDGIVGQKTWAAGLNELD
jgi:hypothetical protein